MKCIGKYEVVDEIGTGSMGTIYRARDQMLDRTVALKVLRADTALEPELKERFYREARACARLAHPNIITVYDLGEADGLVYIAMELLTGSDLRRLFQEGRTIDMALKVDLMAQVCDGLEHAHRQQLVHRDIKPSNIFYCDDQRAKVLDFGIARMPLSKLTMAGQVLGSPNYMAPEQILGAKCDSRSDLFSAAIVFYELLAHSHPFKSEFIPRRIVESPPDSLSEMDPTIPEALQTLLQRSLQKDPEKRIQTAADLGAGLRAVLRKMRGDQTDPGAFAAGASRASYSTTPESTVPPSLTAVERRLAEFMRIISVFDEGVAQGNVDATRAVLEQMGQLAAVDDRFTVALSDCQARFDRMAAASHTAPPAPPPDTIMPSPARNIRRTWLAVGAAVIFLIVMAALVRARGARQRFEAGHNVAPKQEAQRLPVPAVATAIVAAPNADLMAAPSASSQHLATLQTGQVLDVIAIPRSGDRDYTNVRTTAGAAGFVRTLDLANWTGANAEASFSILKLFPPGETAGPADLTAQLDRWNQFIATFPVAQQSPEAYLELARLRLALVKLAKSAGKPATDWQSNLDLAKEALSQVTGAPSLGAEAAQLLQQVQAASMPATPTSPEQVLIRVSSLWEAGRYKQAMALVDQILAAAPNHAEALYWKKKIRDAQEAEAQ